MPGKATIVYDSRHVRTMKKSEIAHQRWDALGYLQKLLEWVEVKVLVNRITSVAGRDLCLDSSMQPTDGRNWGSFVVA